MKNCRLWMISCADTTLEASLVTTASVASRIQLESGVQSASIALKTVPSTSNSSSGASTTPNLSKVVAFPPLSVTSNLKEPENRQSTSLVFGTGFRAIDWTNFDIRQSKYVQKWRRVSKI